MSVAVRRAGEVWICVGMRDGGGVDFAFAYAFMGVIHYVMKEKKGV